MSHKSKVEVEAESMEALRQHMRGETYRQIGESLGISHTTAYNRVRQAMDSFRPSMDYDQYRARQLAELAEARGLAYRTMADEALALGARFGAVDRLVKLHEREAKLLNLDAAPTPLEEAARVLGAASDADIAAELEART